jgi:quercetin dioxygenase-like cupin family protein
MEIRSARTVAPVTMHRAVTVWELFPRFSLHDQTQGTYLEEIEEWTIAPNTRGEPHFHDTHEFYFILDGAATIQIEQDARRVGSGDLVYVPRNAVHTVKTSAEGVRAFSFAVSYQEPKGIGYTPATLPEVVPGNE